MINFETYNQASRANLLPPIATEPEPPNNLSSARAASIIRKAGAILASAVTLYGGSQFVEANRTDTAEAAQIHISSGRSIYQNQRNNFANTTPLEFVRQCMKQNTGVNSKTIHTPWSWVNGNIETLSTSLRGTTLTTRSLVRDVNMDEVIINSSSNFRSEFYFGCTYVSKSHTELQLEKKDKANHRLIALGAPNNIAYQEDPTIFHTTEFVNKFYSRNIQIPHFNKRLFSRGAYCLKITQFSEAIAKPWDQSLVEQDNQYKLLNPNSKIGVMYKGDGGQPTAMKKSWLKCLTNNKQLLMRSPKNSPWAHS